MAPTIAYLTDLEGRWDKLQSFAAANPHVGLDADGRLQVAAGALLVFGGDAIDRGPAGRRIVATLLDVKSRHPDRVVLLAGNRDLNKLRLRRELGGHPPPGVPPELARGARGELLRWIFHHTMGASRAFAMRADELAPSGPPPADDEVVESFLTDTARDGDLARYLAQCQLAFRADATLFVHGAVTEHSLGAVPGASAHAEDVDAWIAALNQWFAHQLDGYRSAPTDDEASYHAVIAYQAPLPGTRLNQASVVYGRLADATNNPHLPPPGVIARLRRGGVERLVIGHTPSGDAPVVLRGDGFELVCADNSYGRLESGARVVIAGRELAIAARARLDSGAVEELRIDTTLDDDLAPLGRRDATTGHLVGAQLARGGYYLYRGGGGYAVEQLAEDADQLRVRTLVPPR